MKKIKMNTFIFVTIVIVLSIISISVSATLISNTETSKAEKEILLEMEKQKQAVAADNALMEYYFKEGEGIVYPDYFAGRYIEDGIYYLCLYNPPEGIEEKYNALFGDNKEKVVYLYKDYSYNDLNSKAKSISENLCKDNIEFVSICVDEKNGKIKIGVDEEAKSFNSLSSWLLSNCNGYNIEFVYEKPYEPMSSHNGGSKLSIVSTSKALSLSLYGKYNNSPAFLTCGHGTVVGSQVFCNNESERFGTIVERRWGDNVTGDFSIGLFNDYNHDMTHQVGNSTYGTTMLIEGTVSNPAIGTIVRRYGYRTGYGYGTVADQNKGIAASIDSDTSYMIYGLTIVTNETVESIPGDSGGPVMVGTAFCGVFSGNISNGFVFTPYSIISAAGFTAYSSHQNTGVWTDVNSGYHSGYCNICQTTVNEPHYLFCGTNGPCGKCGRTGPISVLQ